MIQELLDSALKYGLETLILFGIGFTINFLRSKVGAENFNKYINLAHIFVHSVEQEFGAGMGADKKAEVIQLLKNASKGKLSDEMIDKMIESAVFDMNHEYMIKK